MDSRAALDLARFMLGYWLYEHSRQLTRKQAWRICAARRHLKLDISRTKHNQHYDGWIFIGRQSEIHIEPDPELPWTVLIAHEVAHLILWVWRRDGGHNRLHARLINELVGAAELHLLADPPRPGLEETDASDPNVRTTGQTTGAADRAAPHSPFVIYARRDPKITGS